MIWRKNKNTMKTLIKGITSDSLLNIELTETKFSIVDKVPFDSDLGRQLIDTYTLEYLYNNRYLGVSALDCVATYLTQSSLISLSDSYIDIDSNTSIFQRNSFCQKERTLEKIQQVFDRHKVIYNHFSVVRNCGYEYTAGVHNHSVLVDFILHNNYGYTTKVYTDKEHSRIYEKWKSEKENLQKTNKLGLGGTFLTELSRYVNYIHLQQIQ